MADFFTGFLQGRQEAAEREIKKMELKALQAQLKAEEAKAGAKNDLLSLLMGSPATPDQEVAATGFGPAQGLSAPGGQPFVDEQAQFMAQGTPEIPGMNIKQALSDPRGQALALQSGMLDAKGLTDILAKAQLQDFLASLNGGGGNGFSPASVSVANLTGDAGQLRPRKTFTKDMMTPDGPRTVAFDEETLQPVGVLGTPKEEKVSPEQGGRISGLIQAQDIAKQVRGAIITPQGINRPAVVNMQGALGVKGVPFTEGRQRRQQMENAIDAVVRARTGAAMTKDEMQSTLDQFMPSPLDSDETIVDKMDRFDQFVGGALDVITLPENIRKKLEKKPATPTQKAPAEVTARNPKTGEVLVLRNGKWVKP